MTPSSEPYLQGYYLTVRPSLPKHWQAQLSSPGVPNAVPQVGQHLSQVPTLESGRGSRRGAMQRSRHPNLQWGEFRHRDLASELQLAPSRNSLAFD
jgi:hypothetical protein